MIPSPVTHAAAPASRSAASTEVERLVPIKDNLYCTIEGGLLRGEPVIVKRYRGTDATLARREAEALAFVADMVEGEPGWMAARPLRFDADTNTLVMERLPGQPLSSLLARADRERRARDRLLFAMDRLGSLLSRIRAATLRPGASPSPFLLEYMAHVSAGLEALPGLGPALFRGSGLSAVTLWQELVHSGEDPSWSHGDLVFRNMVISGDRLGIIDLANTNGRAHLLNDLYGLEVALESAPVSQRLRAELRRSLRRGLRPLDFPPEAHRFYWELNRRRWLYLHLRSHRPGKVARGVYSLGRVGYRYDPRRLSWPPRGDL